MRLLSLTIMLILGLPLLILSQTLNIHEKSGTVHSYTMSEIDSITFSQDGGGIPCPGLATVEYEGQIYNTVQIGDQCWLRENLNVGTMITCNSGEDNQTDNGVIEKYCYDNDEANCNIYGGLYQFHEAMHYSEDLFAQGICPPGWHIPLGDELQTLLDAVGGDGNALKAIGQGVGAGAGTNTSGFSALLAGYRHEHSGEFSNLDYYINFWSSGHAYVGAGSMGLHGDDADVYNDFRGCHYGLSVRCLKE